MFIRAILFIAVPTFISSAHWATANPTIDKMTVQSQYRLYSPSSAPGLFLIQRPSVYFLSNGSSWMAGAGVGQLYETRVSQQDTTGGAMVCVMDRPVGALIFGWTDYNGGDHQAQGTLASTAPLILTAEVGSAVAMMSGYAEVISNDPTAFGDAEFNYYSASVGDWVPFQLTYTLRDGKTWNSLTFNSQFRYDTSGFVDFAAAIPEPGTVLMLALGGVLLKSRSRRRHSSPT